MNATPVSSSSSRRNPWPLLLMVAYVSTLKLLGGLRSDQLIVAAAVLILSYGGRFLLGLRRFIFPLILTGIIYDSMRFYADYLRGPIHVSEPYQFDLRFFGITAANGTRLTPNEWCQLHTHWLLDFVSGFFYLTFITIFVLIAAYFYFFVSRRGTKKLSAAQIALEAPQTMWTFFWVNMLGYTTYYWYAAAPPWYVAQYGLGPARMDTPASPAGCIRFDALLGTHFFTGMYGRAADVFGAIPSLHIAYPFIAVLFAHRFGSLRAFSWIFYLVMCFSAVYLNHHYMLDLIWGTSYSILVFLVIQKMGRSDYRFFKKPTA